MNTILSLAVMLLSGAQQPPTTVESAAIPDRPSRPSHHFGILVDAGIPDGFGVSLAFRPVHWVRLEVGALENTVSPGIRGGLTLIPFNFWITPTLTLEGGHYFPGNANRLAQMVSRSNINSPLLQDFNYDYANAHLGLELGSSRIAFYLRGGFSYVTSTLHHTQQALQQATSDPSLQSQDAKVTYRGPSAKLGFIVYFL